jgi:hypothetical protein
MLPVVYHRYADKPKLYGSWLFGYTESMFQSLKHADHAKKRRVAGPCVCLVPFHLPTLSNLKLIKGIGTLVFLDCDETLS